MIWDKLIPAKYYIKNEVCGVEVCFTERGPLYYYTLVKSRNSKLEIIACSTSEGTLKIPVTVIKNKLPLAVVINGNGVVLKKTESLYQNGSSPDEFIRASLPAINPAEFIFQVYPQEETGACIALCRRELVSNILNAIKAAGCDIAAVYLGAAAAIGLRPIWGSFNTLYTSQHQLELSNSSIDAISPLEGHEEKEHQVEGLSFSDKHCLGFAAGLAYLLQNNLCKNTDALLDALPEKHREKNKLRFLAIACVAIAFTIAVTNVGFYTRFFDRNNRLQSELDVYQGKYDKINQLLAKYQENKDLIENAGMLNRNKLSEYADRIGLTLPEDVMLTELSLNPKNESEESEDSLITFHNKHILLKGKCRKSLVVNEWVNVLKMQGFIKEVSLEKFVYNNEGALPNFEIKLLTE